MNKLTLRSDRDTDYVFTYKGEETVLPAGGLLTITDGLNEVVLPTCTMKIIKGVVVIKEEPK